MFGSTEPARWIALLGALLSLLSVFGIALTEGKIQAIMGVATIAIPLIAGEVTRHNVYSPASVTTALAMPHNSSIGLLDQVLASSVEVQPGDTKAEVTRNVAFASAFAQRTVI